MSTIPNVPILDQFKSHVGYGLHVSTIIEPDGAETVLIDRRQARYDGAARITRVYGPASEARQQHDAIVAAAR